MVAERQAHEQAMAQLGTSIKRLVALMAENHDTNNPFMFTKLDIKDEVVNAEYYSGIQV